MQGVFDEKMGANGKKWSPRKFKSYNNSRRNSVQAESGDNLKNKKRCVGELMEVDENNERVLKRGRCYDEVNAGVTEKPIAAGLSEQPYEDQ